MTVSLHAATVPALHNDDGLSAYLNKINQFPFLTHDEEIELSERWVFKQDIQAAHELMLSHLRLVAKIAFSFKGYGLPVTDLISEGNIGLMQAIKKFDPDKGFRLSTYAMWWIKAAMQEYILRSWSLVKLGTTSAQKKLFFNLRKLKNRIQEGSSEKSLSDEDAGKIASELNVRTSDVKEMDSRLYLTDRSVDEQMYANHDEGDSTSLIDTLDSGETPHDIVLAEQGYTDMRSSLLSDALQLALNDRERAIIIRRRLSDNDNDNDKPLTDTKNGATLEVLSQEYGVSRERIRQIEARAMEKMKVFIADRLQ